MPKPTSLVFIVLLAIFLASPNNAASASTAVSEVWISAQPNTLTGGTGTQPDPYDGSTQGKFDALMTSFQGVPNLTIHLGAGTFRSNVTTVNRWVVKTGWVIEGVGIDQTVCQMMGNMAGQHWDHEFFKSPYNVSTDNVAIRDLTVDCNWAELSLTADMGAQGEKFGAVFAIALGGSHDLIERVRCTNSRGSWANLNEAFGIGLGTPSTGDATGNTIRYCRADSPQGNYGSPFGLQGWPFAGGNGPHFMTNSSAYGNYAAGNQNGLTTGFTTGGVNGVFLKNCKVYNNVFVDCQSVFYQDTGSIEGLQVTNNTLTRGWTGVALVAAADPTWTKTGVTISGNQLNLQNRTLDHGSASYGVAVSGALSSEISITKNRISFSPTGQGFKQFLTISIKGSDDSNISDNNADEASAGSGLAAPVRAQVAGYGISIAGNKTPANKDMTGLEDQYLEPLAKALNFSTRATVGAGEDQLINGFIVAGNTPKKVLLRAIGPSLAKSGVTKALPDPTIALYDSAGKLVASNDNWKATQRKAIQATGAAPTSDKESAIVATLEPGSYTAVMGDAHSATGVGLVEVYDLAPNDESVLQNVSTRGFVRGGEEVIIGGLIVGKGQESNFVARAVGPGLAEAGIHNPLPDPVLELHDGNGSLIDSNDNWQDSQSDLLKASGLAPTKSRDAALIESLPAGNYTTIVRGKHGATGVALVELYRLQ